MSNLAKVEAYIFMSINKQFKKRLSETETAIIKKEIANQHARGNLKNKGQAQSLINAIIAHLKPTEPIDTIDIYEYQKQIIGTSDTQVDTTTPLPPDESQIDESLSLEIELFLNFNANTLFELSAKLNPRSKQVYHYLMLDTNNAEMNTTRNTFKWYINYAAAPRSESPYINLHAPLRNIEMMRIGQAVYANTHVAEVDILEDSRTAWSITELHDQSIISPTGVKFHFLQKINNSYGNLITTTSFNLNRGWFRFRQLHFPIDTITLNIYDILTSTRISMPDTYFSISATQHIGPIATPSGASIENALEIPDYKYIGLFNNVSEFKSRFSYTFSGFTTDDPVTDAALIASYNAVHQLSLQSVYLDDLPYFMPPIDISSGTFTITTSLPVTITWLYKPRMTVSLELVSQIESDEKIT